MKASASLAFSSPFAQASVTVTREKQVSTSNTNQASKFDMTITREAHGGNLFWQTRMLLLTTLLLCYLEKE